MLALMPMQSKETECLIAGIVTKLLPSDAEIGDGKSIGRDYIRRRFYLREMELDVLLQVLSQASMGQSEKQKLSKDERARGEKLCDYLGLRGP